MIKTALVNPPLSTEEHYGSLKDLAPDLPLLGIAFLSSYVKKHGFDVDLLDLGLTSPKEAVGILHQYDVVGFSAFITNYISIIALAKALKSTSKNIITVVGGPHATLFPSDFRRTDVDYVISGDGELPFTEILLALKENRTPRLIPGLGYIGGNGELTFSGKAQMIDNLDLIGPPDVGKYDLKRYFPPIHIRGRKVIHTMISRGCPYQCSFCAAAEITGRRIRFRGIPSVIDELKSYKDNGYDSIMFYDDIFTIKHKRVFELCNALIKNKLNLKWSCFTRTDRVNNADMLKAMKEAGCYLITFGCESANDKTLKLLNKGLTSEDNIRGIEMAAKANILTLSSFMIGLPGETEEDILNTITFARKSGLTFAVFPIFEPFRGTPIYEVCKQTGSWQNIQGESNQLLLHQNEVWVPDGMSRSEVVLLARKAFREFYFEPKRVIKLINYILFTLPPNRSFRFLKGGLSYFVEFRSKSTSQSYTHY